MFREVRNSDGRLVCMVDPKTRAIEIRRRRARTLIRLRPDGVLFIFNSKSR
jgi:hypothetical protein